MIVEAYCLIKNQDADSVDIAFNDADELSSWSVEYVKKAVGLKLISGFDDGGFHPKSQLTRAEAAVVIKRLLEK